MKSGFDSQLPFFAQYVQSSEVSVQFRPEHTEHESGQFFVMYSALVWHWPSIIHT